MTPAQLVVMNAVLRYGVRLRIDPAGPLDGAPRGFEEGPQRNASLNMRMRTVHARSDFEPEDLLHELSHVIVGPHSLEVSEGYVLMPFEWRLAMDLSKQLKSSDRQLFMEGVRKYQDNTSINDGTELGRMGPSVRRGVWWRAGEQRAVRLGLLDLKRHPTYARARWRGSDVPELKFWDPSYDYD